VTTYDNGPAPDEWVPYAKHCGEICFVPDCPICGVAVTLSIPANIELGTE
jgi:hypothetical protein